MSHYIGDFEYNKSTLTSVAVEYTAAEDRAWSNNYMPLFYVDVVTYPCLNSNVDLAYPCKFRRKCDYYVFVREHLCFLFLLKKNR